MSSSNLSIFPGFARTKSSSNFSEDTLARQSDVIVSTNITPYAEYKGFFIYVISATALSIWIGWSLIPDSILQNYFSIYYYPDKYWATAIPSYFLMLFLFMYIILGLYNTERQTLPLNDIRNFVDEYSTFAGSSSDGQHSMDKSINYLWKAPSGVWDLPVTLVNEVLYCNEHNEMNNPND